MDANKSTEMPSPSFTYRVLVASSVVIGLLLLLLALWYASQALLLTFAALLIAVVLRSLADWLREHTGMPEGWALTAVMGGALALVITIGVLAAPGVAEQTAQLRERIPEALESLYRSMQARPFGRWLLDLLPTLDGENGTDVTSILLRASGVAYTAVQVFFGLFILLFVAIYLSINPRLYTNGVLHLVPVPYRARAAQVMAATGFTLRWWMIGSLARMLGVGLLTFGGLWALDIPLAMILAILAGILDFVPYFGPIVAAVPAVLLAFTEGVEKGLWVILLYVIIQQIESLVISPLIYHRTVYLPPVLTILAQIILFAMAGILGVLLATPLIAVAIVWVKMLYVEGMLGDLDIPRPEKEIGPGETPPLPGSGSKKKRNRRP